MQKQTLIHSGLAIVACLLWSTAFVGIKYGLVYTEALQFAGLRFFLSGLLLLPLVKSRSDYFAAIKNNFKLVLKVSAFQTFILYGLFYTGLDLIEGAMAAIVIGSQPLFAALVAHLLMKNDKMSLSKSLSISLGIGGIILIALPKGISGPEGWSEVLGIVLLVLANIASGIGNVIVSKKRGNISPIILNSSQMILGGMMLYTVSLFTEPFTGFIFPMEYYLSLLWLTFLSAAAFSIWFFLLQKPNVKVSELNIYKFIIPVFGASLSWLILPNESPNLISIIGMLIIGASVILYSIVATKN